MQRTTYSLLIVGLLALAFVALAGGACGETPDDASAESSLGEQAAGIAVPSDPGGTGGLKGEVSDLGGLGDAYLPQAGNGGYDTVHYEIVLWCDPTTGVLEGTTSIEAEALRGLEAFHLDLTGLDVRGVEVDGTAAEYARVGQELIVDCPKALEAGDSFTVAVAYSGSPVPLISADGFTIGWQRADDAIYTLDEPEGAATWYPLNDHPLDKATYSFSLTVPKPYVATANGVLVDTRSDGEEQTFVWEMRQPMANYLAAVVVGQFVLQETVSSNGVPIRNYFAVDLAERAEKVFERTGEVLAYFSEEFGPYPFETYGVVVPSADIGAAMENQTLSLFGRDLLDGPMRQTVVGEMYLSHELAHQWFGDSVTLAEWQDIWLNEGFATYASWLWAEHDLGEAGMDMWVRWALDALAEEGDIPPGDPGLQELFGVSVYQRGALTLHALRLTVGDDIFFDILREWVSRHAYGNATTEDFMTLVKEKAGHLAGVDLEALLDAWLFQRELPELPEQKAAA